MMKGNFENPIAMPFVSPQPWPLACLPLKHIKVTHLTMYLTQPLLETISSSSLAEDIAERFATFGPKIRYMLRNRYLLGESHFLNFGSSHVIFGPLGLGRHPDFPLLRSLSPLSHLAFRVAQITI